MRAISGSSARNGSNGSNGSSGIRGPAALGISGMAVSLALTLLAPGAAAQDTPPPPARPADVASIDAIVAAVYEVISGPAGQRRDWDRMRSLFIPGARLIPTGRRADGSTGHGMLTVDGYISSSGPRLEETGFFETEIHRVEERFGNIAHLFSTYESRRKADDAQPFARGINSIQVIFDGTRWWIVTIFWQNERTDTPIPDKYLKP